MTEQIGMEVPQKTAAARRDVGGSRVLTKLSACLESGQLYEAHQMYRTLYYRYLSQQKYTQLLELLYSGSLKLIEKGQLASGTDLAELYTEALNKGKLPLSDSILCKLEHLFRAVPASVTEQLPSKQPQSKAQSTEATQATSSSSAALTNGIADNTETTNTTGSTLDQSVVDRSKFVEGALSWSKLVSQSAEHQRCGHPDLHQRFASVLWSEEDFPRARYHFLLSNDGEGCAAFLVDYQTKKGFPSEADLFITQAVLQYLCNRNSSTATVTFHQYTALHPRMGAKDGPPFQLPLLNFLWLLLLAVDLKKLTYFVVLVEKYERVLSRDASYFDQITKIGQIFFGVPAPPKQKGLLEGLIQGLMGGTNEESEQGNQVEVDNDSSDSEELSAANSFAAMGENGHSSSSKMMEMCNSDLD